MKILTRVYLALAVLFVVLGIVQCHRWPNPPWGIMIGYLFHFVPAILLAMLFVLAATQRKLLHTMCVVLCVFVLGYWAIFTLSAEMWIEATTEIRSVKKYAKVLDDYWASEPHLVSHFPRPIPPDAENVRFSFLPGFLQGGAHIQLCYSTSPDVIDDLYARFAQKKEKSFFGGDASDHANADGGMHTTYFYTGDSEGWDFPEDFEIMVLEAIPSLPGDSSWNHGKSCGVAISRKRNEIVYWAELW